jgi:hypothetical protein
MRVLVKLGICKSYFNQSSEHNSYIIYEYINFMSDGRAERNKELDNTFYVGT